MIFVAVDAPNLVVRTVGGLASLDMLSVEGGEVVSSTLAALGSPCTADVSRVTPLMTSGALSSGRGDCPWLAPPNDANEGDGRLKQFLGHKALACVPNLDLEGGTEWVGVPLGEHEPGWFQEFCVLPSRISPEEDRKSVV